MSHAPEVRTFSTGASRDTDEGKLDFEGFLSPLVLEAFAQYMHQHRVMADGSNRASDNWTRGIPKSSYMQSLWRHFHDVWMLHRGFAPVSGVTIDEALCAMLFNVQGYLHAVLLENVPRGVDQLRSPATCQTAIPVQSPRQGAGGGSTVEVGAS